MINSIVNYIILFFIYATLGWIIEVIYNRFLNNKWSNRGFLVGPICPIYGCGCLLLIFLLDRFSHDFFPLFLGTVFICSLLEYFTSYILEKIFKARWWDYSNFKYNINGRICLETMLPFGLGGAFVVCFINPFIIDLITLCSFNIRFIIVVIFAILLIIDFILSFKVISGLKKSIHFLNGDNTDEIKEKIKNIFVSKSYGYRRLIMAFPNLFVKFVNFNKLELMRHVYKENKKKKRK